MPPEVINSHVRVDEKGVAWIVGTQVKVLEIVLDKQAYGWGPEEIHENFPDLSMARIHGAFAYYYDHKDEVDRQIAERHERYLRIRAETENPETQARFRAAKEASLLAAARQANPNESVG